MANPDIRSLNGCMLKDEIARAQIAQLTEEMNDQEINFAATKEMLAHELDFDKSVNRLDTTKLFDGLLWADGEVHALATAVTSDFIAVEGGTAYIYNRASLSSSCYAICSYGEDKTVLSGSYVENATEYSIPETAKYIRVSLPKSSASIYAIAFEKPTYYDTFFNNRASDTYALSKFKHIPSIRLYGDTEGMTKDDAKILRFDYKDAENYYYAARENGKHYCGFAKVKWQGSSSVVYDKKNYSLKLYHDAACVTPYEIEFREGWTGQNAFCLKANVIDASHARNIVSAKLWGRMVKTRDEASVSYINLADKVNGGAVDGFPVMVFINNEYKGIYTFNLHKELYLWGMSENASHTVLCGEDNGKARFTSPAVIDGDDWDYEVEPTDTSWVLGSFNAIYNALQITDTTARKTALEACVDIDSIIDYGIFISCIGGVDSYAKNMIMLTYDKVKWMASAYDMDTTYGNMWHGCGYHNAKYLLNLYDSNALLSKVAWDYPAKFKARYDYVRKNIINMNVITELYSNLLVDVPATLFDKEIEMYPSIPGSRTNNLLQIKAYMDERLTHLDELVNRLFS